MKLSNIAPLGGVGAKIALRNLTKNKVYSIINIAGLATGMAVAMLIGLWVWDELSFNKNFTNYERIGRLLQNRTFDGKIGTYNAMPIPMSAELKSKFPDFEMVALGSQEEHKFGFKENVLTKSTYFVEADFTKIFDLKMEKGVREGVQNPNTVMISSATAQALFGQEAPIGKTLRMDNKVDFQVTGVFQDFPKNSEFFGIHVIAPFSNYISLYQLENNLTQWGSNSFACFILLNQNASFEQAQAKIFKVFDPHIDQDEKLSNPEVLISRMQDWHLRANYEDGVQQGGAIEIVWLFGIIGGFVLILACINFMNLSTARSERRAKEVGVRKAIGSLKGQLIYQFLSESILITFIAFLFAVTLVGLSLSVFNGIADKAIEIPFQNPIFWVACSVVIVVTGILAGSYPALYLSSFNPVKTLKGTFRVGRFASLPRKVLVVVQFTVSIALIIGTVLVYQQIQYIKNRPIGYDKNGLIFMFANTPELNRLDYSTLRSELLSTGVLSEVSQSDVAPTYSGSMDTGYQWEGIDPKSNLVFETIHTSHDYTNTLGFEFVKGRTFSRDFATDSSGIVLNESAAKLIGEKNIIGKKISRFSQNYTVIGIVKDVIFSSPFQSVLPQMFFMDYRNRAVINMRIKPEVNASDAIATLTQAFKKLNPAAPFDYKFVDQEFAKKFTSEERMGQLATFFAVLAVFISCLGLFGLASFVAEQRTKEIGVRKVLGASVPNLWALLSKDFVTLVVIASLLACPLSYFYINDWLAGYEYHTQISWWVFAGAALGGLAITLLTVSYQAIKAAMMNPVKSLKTE